MNKIEQLFANNLSWAQRMKEENSTYLKNLQITKLPIIFGLAALIVVFLQKN
ncbi:carbonate dehydratase [Rodentibacter pneumotropicus]|uniref:Carbonate dehydratase n=1 Tax=Rodentibacter pneumotropicus TaxID=758 RepID=A0A3S4U771_9PAST|nr:carbonate dehydratase [Rodentibacter pneumotropicus]